MNTVCKRRGGYPAESCYSSAWAPRRLARSIPRVLPGAALLPRSISPVTTARARRRARPALTVQTSLAPHAPPQSLAERPRLLPEEPHTHNTHTNHHVRTVHDTELTEVAGSPLSTLSSSVALGHGH